MSKKARYFHLSEADLALARSIAMLAKWSSVALGLVTVIGTLAKAVFMGTMGYMVGDILHRLLSEGRSPKTTVVVVASVLYFIIRSGLILLPLVYLFKFGKSLADQLETGHEVMTLAKPLAHLKTCLVIVLIECLIWLLAGVHF